MELYHNNMSVCAQKVRLVLAEKKLAPVEHHRLLRNGDTHTPEYLALNPKGVVPTLVDRGHVIVESTIICEYLEDAYPEIRMLEADPLARARAREWTQLPDAGLHRACGVVSVGIAWRHQLKGPGGAQLRNRPNGGGAMDTIQNVIDHGPQSPHVGNAIVEYDAVLAKMAATLAKQPWLAGQVYTLADAALLPYIQRLSHLALGWMWEGDREVINRWFERSCQRANYRGISDYIDPAYVELATCEGHAASPLMRAYLER